MMWFVIGIAIGILNGLSLRWTVSRLRPETSLTSIPLITMGSLLRLGLATALLALASQHSLISGLLAFIGLWLTRWIVVFVTAFPHLFIQLQRS